MPPYPASAGTADSRSPRTARERDAIPVSRGAMASVHSEQQASLQSLPWGQRRKKRRFHLLGGKRLSWLVGFFPVVHPCQPLYSFWNVTSAALDQRQHCRVRARNVHTHIHVHRASNSSSGALIPPSHCTVPLPKRSHCCLHPSFPPLHL